MIDTVKVNHERYIPFRLYQKNISKEAGGRKLSKSVKTNYRIRNK